MKVTKVLVKAQGNELGAKAGLLFLFHHENPLADDFLERFAQYDSWTAEEFQQQKQERYSQCCTLVPLAHCSDL